MKVWRVIRYKGAADIPAGDYPTKKEAEDALRELVDRGNPGDTWTCPKCGRENQVYPYPTRCSRCGYLRKPEGGNPGFTAKDAKSIGKELGIDFKRYDVEQFRQGLDVELEHCNVTNCDPLLTGKIAQAHLNELPDYYTRLAKMEEVGRMKTESQRKSFHERIFGKGSTPPLERLGRGQTVNNMLPMSPESGPPLPRVLGLRWPWIK